MVDLPPIAGTIPQWLMLVVMGVGFFKVLPELIRARTEARKVVLEDAAQQRGEKRDDLDDCKRRLEEMSASLQAVRDEFANLKIEMNGVLSAYRILDTEVEALNPRSFGLAQARVVLSTAFTVAPSTTAPPEKP